MERLPQHDPREWLNRARSNLAGAHLTRGKPGIYLEDVCFNAQQAAEKALKAVLLSLGKDFPKTHNLGFLLTLLPDEGLAVPGDVAGSAALTRYAVGTRYPRADEIVSEEDCDRAIASAEAVVKWAAAVVASEAQGEDQSASDRPPA